MLASEFQRRTAEVTQLSRPQIKRRTIVVEGVLAFRMRRLLAARQRDVGLEIVTLPLLAARLAGGFRRPATRQDLDPAIRAALNAGGFSDLERIRPFRE